MHSKYSLFSGFFVFLSCGIIYTQVTARLPALKAQTGITDSDVGIALMLLGVGSLTGFLTISKVLKKLQVKTVLSVSLCSFLLICLLMSLVHSREILFALFALWGYACAYLDVCMNTHAIFLEQTRQKPCLSSMHACYSAGCLLGSGIGSIFAFADLSLLINFSIVGIILLGVFSYLRRFLLSDPVKAEPSPQKESAEQTTKTSKLPIFIIFCGLMGMFSYCAEGSVAEWGSIVLHQAKGADEGLAALAYGTFALFMAISRFAGDHFRARFGDSKMILFGGTLALIGISIVITSPSPYLCLLGYVFMGIGLSPVFPIAISNASRSKDVSPKTASAIVSFVGYSGLLVIPPLLGFLAEHIGLENALFLPFGAIILVICGSLAFRKRRIKSIS